MGNLRRLTSGTLRPPPDLLKPREFLAICLQINAAQAFVPVAKELRTMGIETSFLLETGDLETEALIQKHGFDYYPTLPLRHPSVIARVAAGSLRLRALWTRASVERLQARIGLDTSTRMTATLKKQIRKSVLAGILRSEAAFCALRTLPAHNVLFITRRALFNTLLKETHPSARRFFFLQGIVPDVPPIRTPLDVYRAFAGGPIDLPYLRRCGIPDEKIILSGYPAYDSSANFVKSACRAAYSRVSTLRSDRPWVLFTSQYSTPVFSNAARMANLRAVISLASRWPDVEFIIKVHPRRESVQPDELPANVYIEAAYPVLELIRACDAMTTFWSTTAIEGLLLGTPLVQLNATGLPDFLLLPAGLHVPVARNSSELGEQLNSALARDLRPSPRDLTESLGPPPDGLAAHRTAVALAEVLRRPL